jgi:hypothetical protein
VVCEQVVGTVRCIVCSKARQSCLYTLSEGDSKGKQVGKILDAAEESSEEEEEEGEEEEGEEEEKKKKSSPLVKVFKKFTSPLKGLGKRKPDELSPGSVQEREVEPSQRARARQPSPSPSVDVPEPTRGSSSIYSETMPPPSSVYSGSSATFNPFYVRQMENDLRASQEDLAIMSRRWRDSQEDLGIFLRRQESRESLLREEIAMLRARLGEGSSEGSGRRGGVGRSSGRR